MKFWKAIFVTMLTFTLCLMPISATHREHNNTQLQEDAEPTSTATDRVLRFLVMGCDRAAGLTDSIFIVTVNETAKQASVLQIPRDTYANYTDRDYKKLNGAKRALGENGACDKLAIFANGGQDVFLCHIDHRFCFNVDKLAIALH